MKRLLICALACGLAAVSCTKSTADRAEDGHRLVPVDVTISADDRTRTDASLFPGVENWIFDYYYCQFNADGVSVTSGHRRGEVVNGDLVAVDRIWLWDLENCTIVYVANVTPAGGTYPDDPGWKNGSVIKLADNIDSYKAMTFDMSVRLAMAEDGTLKHTPMCGYWKGDITPAIQSEENPFRMTVTLGRMLTKITVMVTNKSGSAVNGVTVRNAATKAYLYPQVENRPYGDGDYTDIHNDIRITNNSSATLYFYTAPNFCTGGGRQTVLEFTNAAGKTSSMTLGDDMANGNMNLYMNTIYTYTVTLK